MKNGRKGKTRSSLRKLFLGRTAQRCLQRVVKSSINTLDPDGNRHFQRLGDFKVLKMLPGKTSACAISEFLHPHLGEDM